MFKVAGPFWAHATAGDNVFARLAKTGKKLLRRVLKQRELETTQREVPKPTWNLRSHTVKVDSTTSRLIGGLFPRQVLQTQAAELRRQAALRLIRDARKVPVFAFVGLSLGLGGTSNEQTTGVGSTEDVLYSGIRDLFQHQGVKGGLVEQGGHRFSLQTLQLGTLIGQGCNAAVFEARPSEAPSQSHPQQEENQPPTAAATATSDDADDDDVDDDDDISIISEDDSDFCIIGEEEEEEEEEDKGGVAKESLDGWVLYRLSDVHSPTSEDSHDDGDDDSDIIILARDEGDLQSLPDLEDMAAELNWPSVTEACSYVGERVGVDTADSRSDQTSASACSSSAGSMSTTTFTSETDSTSTSATTDEPEPAPNILRGPPQQPPAEFPLAVKMMYNYTVESKADHIYRAMAKEAIPALSGLQGGGPDSSLQAVTKRLPPHPNIVTMYDVFVDQTPDLPEGQNLYPSALPPRLNRDGGFGRNATMFLVMKKYTMTLNEYLATHTTVDVRTRCVLLAQLMEGLAHLSAHAIAHRDLKSNNVLVDLSMGADCPHLAITDFGSCLADAHYGLRLPYLTSDTDKGGNSALMAPEIKCAVAGPGSMLDYSGADVWAAGALAYEIFGELNPFYAGLDSRSYRHDQLPPLSADVPEAVVKLIGAMLKRDPSQRPSPAVASTCLQLLLWAPPQLSPFSLQQRSNRSNNVLWRVKEISHWLESLTLETVCRRVFGGGGVSKLELQMKSAFLSRVSRQDVVGVVSFEG